MVNLYSQDMPKDYEKAEVLKLFQGMKIFRPVRTIH